MMKSSTAAPTSFFTSSTQVGGAGVGRKGGKEARGGGGRVEEGRANGSVCRSQATVR